MPNEQYQSLFGLGPADVRGDVPRRRAAGRRRTSAADWDDETLAAAVVDLGGHDIASLLEVFRECDAVTDRPSVVFAYTVKGWGLPIAGNPRNHSALLSGEQIDDAARGRRAGRAAPSGTGSTR